MTRPLHIYPHCGWRGFPDREKVEDGPDAGKYRLRAPVVYTGLAPLLGLDYNEIVLPVGYATDVGSTPRAVWFIYPPVGTSLEPGYWLHDWVYQHPALFKGVRRWNADRAMRRVHKWNGATWFDRQVNFQAVRHGGGKEAWNNYRLAA